MCKQSTIKNALKKRFKQAFGDTPEENLMRAILDIAIDDLFGCESLRRSAKLYFRGGMSNVVACGIDPEWIRDSLRKAGIDINE